MLYRAALAKLLKPSGLLVITSCNSTRDELIYEICSVVSGEAFVSDLPIHFRLALACINTFGKYHSRAACTLGCTIRELRDCLSYYGIVTVSYAACLQAQVVGIMLRILSTLQPTEEKRV